MLALLVLAGPASAAGDSSAYVLRPGDTVQITVASMPELTTKAEVDIDGDIHIPLLPMLRAGGETLVSLNLRLKEGLKQKVLRQRSPDGREASIPIDPDEISVSIAAYRSVYIRGDVSKPGELAYHPGLTARQAIALAGGFDIMRFHMDNPFLQASDLRAEYQSLWTEFARTEALMFILRSTLDGTPLPDLANLIKVPLPAALVQSLIENELKKAKARVLDFDRQQSYLKQVTNNAQAQIAVLTTPRDEAQRSETDEANYKQKLDLLLNKGFIAHERVADQQRSALESTQRYLDYSSRISELGRQRDESARQIVKLDDERRSDLLRDIQDCTVKQANTRMKLESVGEKLLYTGAIQTQVVRGAGSKPYIVLHRSALDGRSVDQPVAEDVQLEPGDVVEVSLALEMNPSKPTNE